MSTSFFARREVLAAGGAGLAIAAGAALLRPQPARQIVGLPSRPQLPVEPLDDDDDTHLVRASDLRDGQNDLTRIVPGNPPASGVPILISGRLTNGAGRPLAETPVEIWNANRWGRYGHFLDPSDLPADPNFAGIGRTTTDGEGRYHFLTIQPGRYPAELGGERLRPAHVHVAIGSGIARRVTQMFFAQDPWLTDDPMFALLGSAQVGHIGREFAPNLAAAEHGFRFDIVTDGPQATFFE